MRFHTFICEPLPASSNLNNFYFSSCPKLRLPRFQRVCVWVCKCVLYSRRVIAWLWHHFLSFRDTIVTLITFYFIRSLNREHFCRLEFRVAATKRIEKRKTNAFTVTWLRQTHRCTTYKVFLLAFSILLWLFFVCYYCWWYGCCWMLLLNRYLSIKTAV